MTDKAVTPHTRTDEIRTILKDLLKVIKIVSMYPENNPLPQSLRRTFAERFSEMLETHGDLTISVFKDYLCWNDETVYSDRSKEENLSGLFFDTGITSLTFGSSFGVAETDAFLDMIKAHMNAKGQKDDLVQTLWEKAIPNFSFTTVEDIQLAEYQGDFRVEEIRSHRAGRGEGQLGLDSAESYDAIFSEEGTDATDGDDDDSPEDNTDRPRSNPARRRMSGQMFYAVNTGQEQASTVFGDGVDEVAFHAAEAAMAMGFGDIHKPSIPIPDTAIILNDELKLTEEDEQCITEMCVEDAQIDMHESTLELLKELLLQEGELPDFDETVTIGEKLHADFLRAGQIAWAGALFVHLRQLEEDIRRGRPAWADRLKEARTTIGSRERLHILAETLNRNAEIPAVTLRHYLDLFGWEALGFIADLLGDLEHRTHRECLCTYLTDRGKENLPLVVKGIYDKRWFVVRNTVIILARIGTDVALNNLKRVVKHEEQRVRMELATSLRDCSNPLAVDILRLLVTDADPAIRSAVIGSLLAQRGERAFDTVKGIVHDPRFTTLDRDERQLVLDAYAAMGGDDAIAYLVALAKRINFWRDAELESFRRAALMALAHNQSAKSEETLLRLARSWRPEIKLSAIKALKRRREVMLADTNV